MASKMKEFTVGPRRPTMGATFEEDDGTWTGYCHGCETRITGASEVVRDHDCEAWHEFRAEQAAARARRRAA